MNEYNIVEQGNLSRELLESLFGIAKNSKIKKISSKFAFLLPDIVKVKGGVLKGYKLKLDLRKYRSHIPYWLGEYELHIQRLLEETVKYGMVAYNIGAHIGFFSLLLYKLVGSKGYVVSFEPNPIPFSMLKENVRLNNANIKLEKIAVGDKPGKMPFLNSDGTSRGRFSNMPYADGEEI
jgi:hypothetical protein